MCGQQGNDRLSRSVGLYVREMGERGLSENYIGASKSVLRDFATDCLKAGISSSRRISVDALRDYLRKLEDKGMAKTSLTFVTAILKGYLRHIEHPLSWKWKPKVRGRARQVRWLTPDECKRLLELEKTPLEQLVVCAGVFQMLRRCQILNMRVGDLRRTITTGRLATVGKNCKELVQAAHPRFMEAASKYLMTVSQLPDSAKVFAKSRSTFGRMIRTLGLSAGLGGLTSHMPRRSGANNLKLLGVPLYQIQQCLGHSSPDTTRIYLDLNVDDTRRAMRAYDLDKLT